jgi:long-chain acyl-CoA synthetase
MSPDPLPTARSPVSFRSVPDMWNHRVGSTPEAPALWHREGGAWASLTWKQVDRRVQAIAAGLLATGLKLEERCAVLAETSMEWILADLAIVSAGGATTTIFPGSPTEDCVFILRDSGATVLFCDSAADVTRLLVHAEELPNLRTIVLMRGNPPPDDPRVRTLTTFENEGRALLDAEPHALAVVQAQLGPGHLATLIYTSGTTGQPKGVTLTHDAWIYEAEAIDRLGLVTPADRQLLFLPLAHVFAKVLLMLFVRLGVPTAVDGNPDRVGQNLLEVEPTFMAAVPRFFEKAYNRIVADARDGGPVRLAAFHWAIDVGRRVSRLRRQEARIPLRLRLQHQIADRLVLYRIRERFGARMRFLISGGAPLPYEIAEFFHAADVLICEGYGMTESGGASCVNTPDSFEFGTVGKPLAGCEVRIASDGEILLRSRGLMKAYHGLPEATADAFADNGWLHTGDIGTIRSTGHVEITDRKKEIIVTASGKNVAPALFQNRLKARSPWISHVLMHGDGRNFCSALITLHEDEVGAWARAENLPWTSYAELVGRPEVRELVKQAIDDVNRSLPSYEQVRRFAILPAEFTVADGSLTPSLKVKRRVVEERYRDVLDGFYEGTVARL